MSSERAKEILKLGNKKADYIRFMTSWETDAVNALGYPQHTVLRLIARGLIK